MGHWGFVFLAYGSVWFVLLLYLYILTRRLRKAEAELALHRSSEDNKKDG